MADLNNEIYSSLENERRAHFLNPTIICGLGDFGGVILDRLQSRFEDVTALKYRELLFFLDFNQHNYRARARLSSAISGRRATLRLNEPGATRALFSSAINDNRENIGKFWQQIAGKMLDDAGWLSQVEATKINLIFVGDSQELGGSVGGIELPIVAREYLTGLASNIKLQVSGLFILPKGVSEKGAEVYAFLQDLSERQEPVLVAPKPLSPLFESCFLVSSINSSGILDASATQDLAVEFLLLALTESKGAIDRLFQDEAGQLATFGISSLVYPATEVIDYQARKFVAELIESEILKIEDFSAPRAAGEFIVNEKINAEGLMERMIRLDESTITAQIDLDPLYFSQIEIGHWPERIASYDAFLESEKTGELLGKLETNMAKAYSESRAAIRKRVDELLVSEPAIEKARNFLLELRSQLSDAHNTALRKQDETLKSLPSLKKRHDQLVHHIQNLPGLSALANRLIVLGTLSFFLALRSLALMRRIPPKYFNVGFLPGDSLAGVMVIVAVIGMYWLIYKRAETKLFRARAGYLDAVEDRHKYIINWWANRDVVQLLGEDNLPELVERHLGSLIGLVEDELVSLDRLKRVYLESLGEFKQSAVNFPHSKIRRPITEAFNVTLDIKYKRGKFSTAEEAAMFLSDGGHADWRKLTKERLEERLLKFVAKGFKSAHVSGVQRVIADLEAGGADFDRALNELKIFSEPYLALTPNIPATVELLATASPANVSWLGGHDLGSAALIGSVDYNSICYLQIARIDMGSISSLASWRQAYEDTPDKTSLHRETGTGGLGNEPPGEAAGGR